MSRLRPHVAGGLALLALGVAVALLADRAVGIVLAAIGVIGGGLPVIALVLAGVCFFLLRRTVGM